MTQLSPWRAGVARGRARSRLDALIGVRDAEKVVPTLAVAQIYDAIMQVGVGEASDLLALCTPNQVRGLLDLDVWERDEIKLERLDPWIGGLLDLGPEALGKALRGLDIELVARYLRDHIQVFDLELEEAPEYVEQALWPSPDRFFLVAIRDEGEDRKQIERLLDSLYRHDLTLARRLLQTARFELDSNLEEQAYRWRAGRMADLGFIDYYEALEIYRPLDPATVKPGEGTADPAPPADEPAALTGPVAEAMAGESFFARVMGSITDPDELARLNAALLTLCNRVLAADRVEPRDLEGARRSLERAHGFLAVGLELVGRGDPAAAAAALRTVALTRLFRAGLSVALKARRLADTLVAAVPTTLVPGTASLLDAPYAQIVAAIRMTPPMTTRLLDEPDRTPPHTGADERPIRTLADLRRVTLRLEEAAAMAHAVTRALGLDRAALGGAVLGGGSPATPAEVRLGDLVRTAAVRLLGGGALTAAPLQVAEVLAFLAARPAAEHLEPAAAARVAAAVAERLQAAGVEPPPGLAAWIDGWLAPLGEHVLGLAPPLDRRLVAGVLMAPAPAPSAPSAPPAPPARKPRGHAPKRPAGRPRSRVKN